MAARPWHITCACLQAKAEWEVLGKSEIPAVHMAWVPGTSKSPQCCD